MRISRIRWRLGASRAGALAREAASVVYETGAEFVRDRAIRLSAAVAFYTALSLAPVLVVILSVAQFFWPDEAARAELARRIDEVFGPEAAEVAHVMLAAARAGDQGGAAALIGLGALLFGATLLFAQLQESLNEVWHVRAKPGRSVRRFLRKRLLSLVLVLGMGGMLVASLVVSSVASAVIAYLDPPEWVAAARIWRLVATGATFAVATALFAAIFVVLPYARIARRDVWFGAALTAALFTIAKELVAVYLGQAAFASGYGAAGSLMAMLVWVYLSAIVFFVGAEVTKVVARRRGRAIEPDEVAEWVPGAPEAAPGDRS